MTHTAGVTQPIAAPAWPRSSARSRVAAAVGFGLLWALTAVAYHAAPLVAGAVTGQNESGLGRIVAGVAMVALGIAVARRGPDGPPPDDAG